MTIIQIDRSTPLNIYFSTPGNYSIIEEDEQSTTLKEVDLSRVKLVTMLAEGESYITNEENLKRLKARGYIPLDAKVLQILDENQHLIPESWKELTNGETTYVHFDGTALQAPDNPRYGLYLYWHDNEWWVCDTETGSDNDEWPTGRLSAVLVP